jgi:hypothetical protein
MKDSEADRKILNSRVIDGNNVKMPENTRYSIMPNDASISMCSDRISRNTTLIALPITITFRKVLSSNRKHFGVSKVPLSFEQRKVFFEKCSEAEVTSSR